MLIAYIVFLHILAIAALARPDLVRRISEITGLTARRSGAREHYRRMVTHHLRMDPSVPDGSVLFVGDSIVQGLCVSAVTDKAVNLGIGNDGTQGVLDRIARYKSAGRARAVVLAIGTKDLSSRTNDDIVDTFRAIIDKTSRDVPLLVSQVLPFDQRLRTDASNKQRIELNDRLAALCERTANCELIEAPVEFSDADGNLRPPYHVGDGVHLNTRGYNVWISHLTGALAKFAPAAAAPGATGAGT